VRPAQLARVLRAAAEEAERIEAEERADRRDWLAQANSPLGPRRHVGRVRARLAAGLDGAALVGRRALLSPAALAEELAAPTKKATTPELEGTKERLERRLALVGGGR
jgi:hypothetical protein